jgi:hypothetical protein
MVLSKGHSFCVHNIDIYAFPIHLTDCHAVLFMCNCGILCVTRPLSRNFSAPNAIIYHSSSSIQDHLGRIKLKLVCLLTLLLSRSLLRLIMTERVRRAAVGRAINRHGATESAPRTPRDTHTRNVLLRHNDST